MSSIPATAKITSATLMLYCEYTIPADGVDIQVYAVSDNTWTENTITWANQPAYGALLNTTFTTPGWNQWVIGRANIPTNGPVSFKLMISSGVEASFNSKENATNQPYLLVTTGVNGAAINLLLLED